ncbi:Sodium-independent sulfate anion transporter [Halotydeus destructor]|nr:Sodium-independent sulfate anion transporter [Halotydeus destructor]
MKNDSHTNRQYQETDYLFTETVASASNTNYNQGYHAITMDDEDYGSSDDEPPSSGSRDTFYGTDKLTVKPKSCLKRRLPILKWLPKYSMADFNGDVIAGVSVAFTIIPQGLAMAALSGLPARDGLYSSFMCCFVYAIFGTRPEVAIGPTSVLAILIVPQAAIGGTTYSSLLSLFMGILMTLFGSCNLGWIVDFVSFPVMSSFATSAAIVTAASQLKEFFGLSYSAPRFVETLVNFLTHIRSVVLYDTLLGLVCLVFLMTLQKLKNFRFKDADTSRLRQTGNLLWLLLVNGRNALVIFATIMLSMALERPDGSNVFILTSEIPLGLPEIKVPAIVHVDPQTGSTTDSVRGVLAELGVSSVILAFIGLMEAVSVVKSLNSSARVDSTQELFAIGLSNIAGSLVGGYPVTGSFSRSALNASSGVRTQAGGIVTGILVILSLVTLAPFFHYIPKTALAATIIASVLPLVKFSAMTDIAKTKPADLIPYLVTISGCLAIGLEYGIMMGFLVSLVLLLKEIASPRISAGTRVTPTGDVFTLVKPDRSIFFPSVEKLQDKIMQQSNSSFEDSSGSESSSLLLFKGHQVIVVDCERISAIDSSFAQGIRTMISSLAVDGVLVIFYQLRPSLVKVIQHAVEGTELSVHFHHCQSNAQVFKMIRKAYSIKGFNC